MKRRLCIVISMLIILLTAGCGQNNESTPAIMDGSPSSTPAPSSPTAPSSPATPSHLGNQIPLTYDEIMRLPSADTIDPSRIPCYSLDEYIELFPYISFAFAKGECLDVQHYLTWDGSVMMGYTLSEIRITEIAQSYNGMNVAVGDVVWVEQSCYIRYKNTEDTKSFFVAQGATPAPGKNHFDLDITPGDYRLILYQDVEYIKFVRINSTPMCVGEDYTFEICEYDGGKFSCNFIRAADEDSLLIANNYYDLRYDEDYLILSQEIAALFSTEDDPVT